MIDDPTKDDFRQMVAAIAVGIEADERTFQGLIQAAKIGWEYGIGRKVRRPGVRLRGSESEVAHSSHKMTTERHPNHSTDYCEACGLWETDRRIADPCKSVDEAARRPS